MKALIGTIIFAAVVSLATAPAAAQHHHAAHLQCHHPWLVDAGWAYGVTGFAYGFPTYGYPAYAAHAAPNPYVSSAVATLVTLNWQQALAREQELRAAAAKREEARRAVHAATRERRHADWARHAEERHTRPQRQAQAESIVCNGKLAWPKALRGDEYQADREAIDRLFTAGPHDGDFGRGSEFALEVERLSQGLAAELKRHIKEMNSNDHLNAKRFVKHLVDVARRPELADELARR